MEPKEDPQIPSERFYTDRSLAIACTRGREAIVRRFTSLLGEAGFTEQQWRVMRVLHDFEPVKLVDLCRLCCIHKVSMTRILRALEERDLLTRAKQPADRRAFDISLTGHGRAVMERLTPEANSIYEGIRRDFGAENTRELLRLLKQLASINERP